MAQDTRDLMLPCRSGMPSTSQEVPSPHQHVGAYFTFAFARQGRRDFRAPLRLMASKHSIGISGLQSTHVRDARLGGLHSVTSFGHCFAAQHSILCHHRAWKASDARNIVARGIKPDIECAPTPNRCHIDKGPINPWHSSLPESVSAHFPIAAFSATS